MNLNNILMFSVNIILMMSCSSPKQVEEQIETFTGYDSKYLIEVDELSSILSNDSVVVIDMRKYEAYKNGHVSGAVNIWRSDIETHALPYSGMIASKAKVEELLGGLGIDSTQHLVIYDDKAMCNAARLWWALDYYGFENTSILHGGLKAWLKEGKGLSKEQPVVKKKQFILPKNHQPNKYISLGDLWKAYNDNTLVIIDTRTKEEYSGEYIKKGAFDKGRLPKSIHMDWAETVNYEENTFKDKNELLALLYAKGIDSNSRIVTYCHTGARSAHTTFVLSKLLGFRDVRNFDGSWTEWSYYKLPLECDSLIM